MDISCILPRLSLSAVFFCVISFIPIFFLYHSAARGYIRVSFYESDLSTDELEGVVWCFVFGGS